MMCRFIRNAFTVAIFLFSVQLCSAQNTSINKENETTVKQNANPYRIITSGKQITVKSSKEIKNIMVWTASGHRILEQKDVNAASYNFRVIVNEKVFFVMLQLIDGKIYSEKIGIQ
jgi:hypothetical protein